MRLLDAPVPAVATVLQLNVEDLPAAPSWAATVLLGLWVAGWILDRMGKLPGNGSSSGFRGVDRDRVNAVHDALLQKDEDGVPRFIRHVLETHGAIERQEVYIEQGKKLTALMETQVRIADDHNKLVGLVTDQLRAINQKIDDTTRRQRA